MKYYLYHIPGKKIGVTKFPVSRIEHQQGYGPDEYVILEESEDIDYISKREIELQKSHGYRVNETLYKQLNHKKNMMMTKNITKQTTTFPCPLNKLKGRLMDNLGMVIQTPENRHVLDTVLVGWIMKHAVTSQFNEDRCYVYNKAMSNFQNHIDSINIDNEIPHTIMFAKIRRWAYERGIYDQGDSKTQYVKLMEEAGELAEALLKNDKPEVIDAIGDMVVVLTNLAKLEKLDIEDCIENAYETISKRTGKMVNGTFVKNTL